MKLNEAANAVEVTPYLKIARDYEASAIKATKNWVGKTVCIEGEVMEATISGNGGALISLGRPEKTTLLQAVFYGFFFDGIPDEVAEIERGDTVKISGRVFNFTLSNRMLIVRLMSSHIVE